MSYNSSRNTYKRKCSLHVEFPGVVNLSSADLDEQVVRKLESWDPHAPNVSNLFHSVTGAISSFRQLPCVNIINLASAAVNKASPEILECGVTRSLDGRESDGDDFSVQSAARYNAFTSLERHTQVAYSVTADKKTQTTHFETNDLSGAFSRSIIYDAYAAAAISKKKAESATQDLSGTTSESYWPALARKLKVVERVISHIILSDVALDFRYYEEPVNDPRDGSLLLLFRCGLPGINLPVTDLRWNGENHDLLGVTFGSYDCQVSGMTGALALFSIKNLLYPEYLWRMAVPAQCVDMHPRQSRLAVVGLHDGNVCVYDILSRHNEPDFSSQSSTKHDTAVEAVRWKNDEEFMFYTISCDGYVKRWTLMKTRLDATIIYVIPLNNIRSTLDGVRLDIKGSGFRIDFHPTQENIYLVSLRRGEILKCNTEICCAYLFSYPAHDNIVLGVKFNPYNPNIFLSCGADWMIYLWEDERSESLLEFNLGHQVTDLDWSPYSSTVFAACTTDGFVHVFDLNIDRFEAICKQKVLPTRRTNYATRLVFNPIEPIIVVGDSRGTIRYLKLSAHLRVLAKASKKETLDQRTLEINKLEKVLSFMKPKTLQYPTDISCIPT